MSARFELVRTDAGWHTRFVSRNGRVILSSEVYQRKSSAKNGLWSLAEGFSPTGQVWFDEGPYTPDSKATIRTGFIQGAGFHNAHRIPVRVVDERVSS